MGTDFAGRPYAEATLFTLAHGFEQVTHHHRGPEACP